MERITYTIEKASKMAEKSPKISPTDFGTIIARIRDKGGKQIKHRTPIVIPASAWVGGSIVLPKKTAANYNEIEEARKSLEEYQTKLELVTDALPIVTGDTIRRAMKIANGMTVEELHRIGADAFGAIATISEDGRSLGEMMTEYAADDKTTRSEATRAGLGTLVASLVRYEARHGKIYLASITAADIQSFAAFLADEEPGIGRKRKGTKRSRNTVAAMISRLRTAANKLAKKHNIPLRSGLFSDTPTQEYAQEPIYLRSNELSTLSAYICTTEAENDVKRAFVFQCCTGMRFGDLAKLQAIHRDQDGMPFVHYVASKTGEQTKVPLSDLAMAQLNEGVGEKILSVPSLPTYNAKIKEILKAAGITRPVPIATEDGITYEPICDHGSSHMARRTFVGRLINANVPAEVVRSMSGHTEGSKAFARYYAITDKQKQEALKKISI